MQRITTISVLLAGAAAVCACSYTDPAPVTAETYAPAPAMTPASAPAVVRPRRATDVEAKLQSDLPTQSQVLISGTVRDACGVVDSDGDFPFDAGQITAQNERVAKQLVDCFTRGAMKARNLRLVGHADPRGSDAYNMALGERRARNVNLYLIYAGMPADRIVTASRGRLDANGHDERTWALDRFVEIADSD